MIVDVNRMVDALFAGVRMDEDAAALREELRGNCQERYRDLIAQGYTDTQAVSAVAESLRGMEEIVSQLPGAEREAELPVPVLCVPEAEPVRESVSPVRSLAVTLKALNLRVEVSPDGQEHVEMSEELRPLVEVQRQGDRLILRQLPGEKKLNFRLFGLSAQWDDWHQQGDIRVQLPAALQEARISTASGDVFWQTLPVERLEVQSKSGDLEVYIPANAPMESMTLHSVSGDIRAEAHAGRTSLTSTSGDISWQDESADLTANSMSGDLYLEGAADSVNANSTSGDVHLTARARKVVVGTVSGDIVCRLSAPEGDAAFNSVSGDVTLTVPAEAALSLQTHTLSGDVSTDHLLSRDPASLTAKIETISGDIRVRT